MKNNIHKSQPTLMVGKTLVQFDFEDNDLALFVFLGSALAEVQAFEMSVGLVLAMFSSKTDKATEDISTLLGKNIDKTLGYLIKLFLEVVKDEEIGNILRDAKEKRNLLVHRILRKYGWPLMSDEDYLKCYKEIHGIRDDINRAASKLAEFLNSKRFSDSIAFSFDLETGKPYFPGRDDLNSLFDKLD